MTDKHHYQVFGLHVESDILLPELVGDNDPPAEPQVSIVLGKVPGSVAGPILNSDACQAAVGQFLLRVPEVAGYYVAGGGRIVVEPAGQAGEYPVRLFLLGTSFGALLMQRGVLPLHGSTVVVNGHAVVFTGVSGAGKSSLLAAFRKKGYLYLTDDVVAVTVDPDGAAWVSPSYPQQKLWRDSTRAVGVDTVSLTPFYTGADHEKYAVPAPQGFWQSPAPLSAVYEIEAGSHPEVGLRELRGVDKLAVLLSHTYRPWLVDGLGLKEAHFKLCAAAAEQAAVSLLTRPADVFSLDEQVRLVEQDLARLGLLNF
ncbi:hypothetical protein ACOBQJ_13650 [Pelotomaculum propionicicum]|uniref:hypothetical protein n=1 Tax=Pelotomaculum propionicicum TaxID=258475 RepID=UPI003B7C56DC